MPKTKSIYRSFGGKGATLTYYARLYLGPDHLLQTASTGYSETYKRFYFRDIQAIVIRKTNAGLFWTFFWLIPAFIMALVAVLGLLGCGWVWGLLEFHHEWLNEFMYVATGLALNFLVKAWFSLEVGRQLAEDRRQENRVCVIFTAPSRV